MKTPILLAIIMVNISSFGQNTFTSDPDKTEFISSDIPKFWLAFDRMGSEKNPFEEYIKKGSKGLIDFIPNRIESARHLLKTVEKRKTDYEAIRKNSSKVTTYSEKIRKYYIKLKDLYPKAVFPPTYFVIGAFNSGGTSSDNGLIIGVEMQSNIDNIPNIVAHELIHFNQHYNQKKNSLLKQSIMEGSADFISEMLSGKNVNETAFQYGNLHEKELCSEFVKIMDDNNFHGWLYGTKGKKKGRPNDLGYWMGSKICQSYYDQADDKKQAIFDILNISDIDKFLNQSGYLEKYLNQ